MFSGGSQGIGLWVAVECAKRGANVTLIARNIKSLEKAKLLIEENCKNEAQKIEYYSLDVSANYDDVEKAFKEIEEKSGPIFMLVNCAGAAICGRFEEIDVKDARWMMDLNYFGTYYATRCVVPGMKKAQDGIIVFTASQAALLGIYGYSAYAASKFALRGLAETVAMETKQHGISVTLALPRYRLVCIIFVQVFDPRFCFSDTDTPGFQRENLSKPEETKLISGSGGLAHPKDVAEKIVKDALNGSFFSIRGFESFLVSHICVGMSTWNGPFVTLFQVLFLGPLRLVALGIQWNFQQMIKRVQKKQAQQN